MQVAPSEIEALILAHPEDLVVDACVAGVSGGRTSDEKVPRAWVVLSERGHNIGRREALRKLDEWTKKNLSKYKWLRGGITAVNEVGNLQIRGGWADVQYVLLDPEVTHREGASSRIARTSRE